MTCDLVKRNGAKHDRAGQSDHGEGEAATADRGRNQGGKYVAKYVPSAGM
jgi:hypothetical protein